MKASGQSWTQETREIKELYKNAQDAQNNHKVLFPDYTYQPVRKENAEHEVISMEEWNAS